MDLTDYKQALEFAEATLDTVRLMVDMRCFRPSFIPFVLRYVSGIVVARPVMEHVVFDGSVEACGWRRFAIDCRRVSRHRLAVGSILLIPCADEGGRFMIQQFDHLCGERAVWRAPFPTQLELGQFVRVADWPRSDVFGALVSAAAA